MEEALKDALLHAGNVLAEAMREGLALRGFDATLSVLAENGRVTVASHSRDVWAAELGVAGSAPSAPMSGVARSACGAVVSALQGRLQEALR